MGLPPRSGADIELGTCAWHLCLAGGDDHYAWRVKGLSVVFGSILRKPNLQSKLSLVMSGVDGI